MVTFVRLQRAVLRTRGLLGLLAIFSPLGAVERTVELHGPATVPAGSALTVTISARSDAGQGERIGFFQAEASADGGLTWQAVCYLDNLAAETQQTVSLTAGAAGTVVKVRVRVAFRDGLAGDVDYRGAAIRWTETWGQWREPPAKSLAIAVVAK